MQSVDMPEPPAVVPPSLHKQNASQAYKTSSYHGISEREVMAEAFRIMVTNLYSAKDAFTSRTLDVMCDYNVKTLNIIGLLANTLQDSGALSDPESRTGALFMATTYNDVFVRLTNIVRAPDPAKEFDDLIALLTPIYRRWLPSGPAEGARASSANGGTF